MVFVDIGERALGRAFCNPEVTGDHQCHTQIAGNAPGVYGEGRFAPRMKNPAEAGLFNSVVTA